MTAAAVQNFNSPMYVDPPFNAMGGPSLQRQRNGDMLQRAEFEYYNRNVNDNEDLSPDAIIGSERWTTLSAIPTMAPGAGRFPDVETYNRRNQNPRTMMDHAEAPYGNARGEKSIISWNFNAPEPLLKVNNDMAQKRQRTRERMCRF
jgi:hypothetical protein